MSNPSIERLRREYQFGLAKQENRCVSCRHARALNEKAVSVSGDCTLLDIRVHDVDTSVCPGWQTMWDANR
jgi:hypothetical protein